MSQHQVRYVLIRRDDSRLTYPSRQAASLADVTLQELEVCLDAGLLTPVGQSEGEYVFSEADVERLSQIRRLQRDIELDLDAIEVVLYLRDQLVDLQREVAEQRQAMFHREQELLETIRQLRRQLAMDAEWR